MKTAALAALMVLAAAAPPAAGAGAPFTIGQGVNPRVAVAADGTAHVAWGIPLRVGSAAGVGYCRLPRGATACDRREDLLFPSAAGGAAKSGGDVTVQLNGAGLLITAGCYTCDAGDSQEGIQQWLSSDGGATFKATAPLGGTPTNIGFGPDGLTLENGVFVAPADGDAVVARPGPGAATKVDLMSGDSFVHTPSIVQIPGSERLVYASSDLSSIRFAVFNGPGLSAEALMDAGRWVGDQQLPSAEAGSQDPRVTSGPSGVWLSYKRRVALDDHVLIRRFDPAKSTFAAPRAIESAEVVDESLDDASSSQDAAGRVHVVWHSTSGPGRLRYTRSDPSGGTFAGPVTLAAGEAFMNPEVGAGPDGTGWAAWQTAEDAPIRVTAIDSGVLSSATGGSGSPTASTKTRARTARVTGATVSFRVPAGCVKRGKTFKVTLTWKRQKKKGNVFVKITRTDFYVGTKRKRIDRKAPFTATLRIAATAVRGSKVTVRARAFIKQRTGRSPKKSIRTTIRACP